MLIYFGCRNLFRIICCSASLMLGVAQQALPDFNLTKVADSTSLPSNNLDLATIVLNPQLNNNRQVALLFQGNQLNQQPTTSIYRWEAGSYTKIVGVGDSILGNPPVWNVSTPVISDSGSIAFKALFRTGSSGADQTITSFVRWNNSNTFSSLGTSSANFPTMAINAQDHVFSSVTELGINRIRSWDANGIQRDYNVSPLNIPFEPQVDANDKNQIAFRNASPSSNTSPAGIYVITDSGVKTIANTADGFAEFTGRPAINNAGQVAFTAVKGSDPFGPPSIYRGGIDEPFEMIANQSDFSRIVSSSIAMNESGNILFTALKDGSTALFSGGNPLTDRIIGTGDLLDGGRITTLVFQNGMLNDNGDFVFYAALDDNNDGIADRGTVFLGITAVPEPSTWLMLLVAGLGVCVIRATAKSPFSRSHLPSATSLHVVASLK